MTHLHYFQVVADEGQITRAAAELHLAQPALSQAIANLESELGVRLFERHARGVTLTKAGDVFYRKACDAVAASDDAARTASALRRATEGTLAFGFIGTPPQLHIPQLLDAFAATHPGVVLDYQELRFPSGPTRVWLADVDVALCHLPPRDPDLWVRVLRREPRVVLAPRSNPIASKTEVSMMEALDETFIGLHPRVERWWREFWSLDDYRGGPPQEQTDDRATCSQELFAAMASRRAITTTPSFQADLIATVVAGVAAIPLSDAEPAVLGLVGRNDNPNPLVQALIKAAESVGDDDLAPAEEPS